MLMWYTGLLKKFSSLTSVTYLEFGLSTSRAVRCAVVAEVNHHVWNGWKETRPAPPPKATYHVTLSKCKAAFLVRQCPLLCCGHLTFFGTSPVPQLIMYAQGSPEENLLLWSCTAFNYTFRWYGSKAGSNVLAQQLSYCNLSIQNS